MSDEGHVLTEDILRRAERKIAKEYAKAEQEVSDKFQDYLRRFEIKDRIKRDQVERGVITREEYNRWRIGQIAVGKRWEAMRDALAQDYFNADRIAHSIAESYMPEVYALNYNFQTYHIEHTGQIDTSFTLYRRETVEWLIKNDDLQLLPPPSPWGETARRLAEHPDLIWNKQKLQSAILQGILQGESIPAMAKRVEEVGEMDHRAAIRNARTMATTAQNTGRYDAIYRAKSVGVDQVLEWQATLDARTRTSHRMMHGQRREVGQPFEVDGVKIMYAGDPYAPQKEIWSCRCTILSWVRGYEGKTVTSSPKMGDMTFEEWQKAKPVSNPIDLPERKAERIRWKYIQGYKR